MDLQLKRSRADGKRKYRGVENHPLNFLKKFVKSVYKYIAL